MPYLSLLFLALLIGTIVDIAGADEDQIRGLPRTTWILLTVMVPVAGSIAWFIAGRPARRPAEYTEPGRSVPEDPGAVDEFRRQCRERAEHQRQIAQRQRGDGPN